MADCASDLASDFLAMIQQKMKRCHIALSVGVPPRSAGLGSDWVEPIKAKKNAPTTVVARHRALRFVFMVSALVYKN
jgi:hypothetical protein